MVGGLALLLNFGTICAQVKSEYRLCSVDTREVPISSIANLEGVEYQRTFLPLGGVRCTYQLIDGGTYVYTSSWGLTNNLLISAGVVTGGVVLLKVTRVRKRARN